MSHQITKVDLIPNGELSVCNVSQFDNGRVLPFEITENKEAYTFTENIRVELHCRKPDGNIVTLPSESISNNIVTFLSTTQLTACYGKNICEIALYGPDDYLIGSGNFILDVEKSPTLGGINSTTAIHNLEEQIEEITTEIVGENYYNKTEIDNKLSLKADASDVYTKAQTDTLLNAKANASDVYTKAQTDTLLNAKANASDVYTKAQTDTLLNAKANASDVYTKTEVDNIILDIMPVDTAFGPIATFNTKLAVPLVNVSCNIVATGGGGTPASPVPIVGYSQANINANGDNVTITFGQTVYGGVLDVTRGKLTVTHNIINLGDYPWRTEDGVVAGQARIVEGYVIPLGAVYNQVPICSGFTGVSPKSYDNINYNEICFSNSADTPFIRARTSLFEGKTEAEIRSLMNGIQFVYELDTPFDIDLTPEVISAIAGANAVSSDTGNIEVKYKTTIQDYLDHHTGG